MYNSGWRDVFQNQGQFLGGFMMAGFGIILLVVAIWTLFWKGLALWKAARSGSKWWFVVLLLVNTLGILEILYIYIFSNKGGIRKMMQPAKPIASAIEDEKDATVV